MVSVSDFRPDDQRTLMDMLEIRSRRVGRAVTLADLVEGWTAFVDKLERGQQGSRLDYEQGLSVRATLVRVEECLSVDGRQRLLAALLGADRRFVALTVPTPDAWKWRWWQRVPPGWAEAWASGSSGDDNQDVPGI